jgi:hypothetical protein
MANTNSNNNCQTIDISIRTDATPQTSSIKTETTKTSVETQITSASVITISNSANNSVTVTSNSIPTPITTSSLSVTSSLTSNGCVTAKVPVAKYCSISNSQLTLPTITLTDLSLDIRTKSIEATLVPLVTQVRFLNCQIFTLYCQIIWLSVVLAKIFSLDSGILII